MSAKARIGQIWTDSVAYVALLTGAGLSIAGNVANVIRTRGAALDQLDIVLAVAYPALVVLMVEVFVSARWRGLSWPMQVLRWLGTAFLGGVAMRVSWVHLHALMTSRGQTADVATLGPLAIDFLAIMATALILAGRGRVPATPTRSLVSSLMDTLDTLVTEERLAGRSPSSNPESVVSTPTLTDTENQADVNSDQASVADEARTWLDSLSDATLDSVTTPAFPIQSTPTRRPGVVSADSVPADAADLIMAWLGAPTDERPAVGQADALVAAVMGVTSRTARRWRTGLLNESDFGQAHIWRNGQRIV